LQEKAEQKKFEDRIKALRLDVEDSHFSKPGLWTDRETDRWRERQTERLDVEDSYFSKPGL